MKTLSILNLSDNMTIFYNNLIIGALVLFVPILFCLAFSTLGNVIRKPITSVLIYSFMAGMMIVMSTFGLMKESFTNAEGVYESKGKDLVVILIVLGGTTIGVLATLFLRMIIGKHNKEIHEHHELHNHSDMLYNINEVENKQSFWMVLISLLAHKMVAGLALGMFIYDAETIMDFYNLGLVMITLIHMIPEAVLVFHKYYSISKSLWKSIGITFLAQTIVFIFMIGSSFIFETISKLEWLMPLLLAISGGSILFVSVIDLVPEFIHNKNESNKQWYLILFTFCLGVIISVGLTMVHHH